MSAYKDRLNPWVVTRRLPDMQQVTIARFRKFADAEGRLRFLQRTRPYDQFMVAFAPLQSEAVSQPTS